MELRKALFTSVSNNASCSENKQLQLMDCYYRRSGNTQRNALGASAIIFSLLVKWQ
jgi:hypothetical protein